MASTLDTRVLREVMSRYLEALEAHREEIDSLNVFPVPDGDTGTNLLLTQRAVEEAVRGHDDGHGGLFGLGETIARAALMGARGNSGVILSQMLRGLCARLCADTAPDGRDLAQALARAEKEARRSVAKPVEGTMLTVLRDAAEAARGAAADREPGAVAEAALAAARASLGETTELLPDLKAAGVVDSGGVGVVLLLDALVSAVRGVPLSVEVGPLGPVGAAAPETPALAGYGYEVMYLIDAGEVVVPRLRDRLESLGDSVVVVGGGGLYNVHVHTEDAGAAVEAGIAAGRPHAIRITSLDAQVSEACIAGQVREVRVEGEAASAVETLGEGSQAVVAVAEGRGLVRLFRSLGAIVVPGGPGNNPSVRQLVDALDAAPGEVVHLLPNHKNVIPAAEAAAAESRKQVELLRTRSIPKGLAALAAFTLDAPPGDNHAGMLAAHEEAASGAIAFAERAAETPAGAVGPGDCLGLADAAEDREVRVVGPDPGAVAPGLVRVLRDEHHELLTLYVGEGVSEEEAAKVAAAVGRAHPDLEVEVHRGDQRRYPYLIGLE